MQTKKDICPECKEYLEFSEVRMKYICPTQTCPFTDRRQGSSVVDPTKDRRTNDHDAWKIKGYRR